MSQMQGGKKINILLFVKSHLDFYIYINIVIVSGLCSYWICFLKYLGSCGLWEGLGAWGGIYFLVHMIFINGNKAGCTRACRCFGSGSPRYSSTAVTLAWEILCFFSSPMDWWSLLLLWADTTYSHRAGAATAAWAVALKFCGVDGGCWGVLETATGTGSN